MSAAKFIAGRLLLRWPLAGVVWCFVADGHFR
jgi:hypothetical protein